MTLIFSDNTYLIDIEYINDIYDYELFVIIWKDFEKSKVRVLERS
jgi:hypothetical protein